MKFLITGANGDIAKSICKLIKKNFKNAIVDGTDTKINKKRIKNLYGKIYKVPLPKNKSYLGKIIKLSNNYNLIIPTTENEIIFISNHIHSFKNKVLINSKNIIKIFSSKLNTYSYLKKRNFKVPKFCFKLDYLKKFHEPFFLKKDFGHGNKNYKVISSNKEFLSLKKSNKNWIAQEYLDKSFKEYTCGIVRLKKFSDVIILERKLKGGYTYFAKRVKNKRIKNSLLKLAKDVNLNGCINVQLKYKKNRYAIFEINPRISSTVYMRDMLNFKDCYWWINYLIYKKIPSSNYKILNKSIIKINNNEKYINQ